MTELATICLTMIVKDEAPVIERCLDSVKKYITHWCIVDTGSTDGTHDIIRKAMSSIPGTLHERPWVGFGHNRTEAHKLAKGVAKWHMVIDADETLDWNAKGIDPKVDAPALWCDLSDPGSGFSTPRAFLLNDRYDWEWKGGVHHRLTAPNWPDPDSKDDARTTAVITHHADGKSWRDVRLKYLKRATVLESEVIENGVADRWFSLAKVYQMLTGENFVSDATERAHYTQRCIFAFNKVLELSEDPQEVYHALLEAGKIQDDIGRVLLAYEYRPQRPDAIYQLGQAFEGQGRYVLADMCFREAQRIVCKHPKCGDTAYHDTTIRNKVGNDIKRVAKLKAGENEVAV